MVERGLVLEDAVVVDAGDLGEVVSGEDEAVEEEAEALPLRLP